MSISVIIHQMLILFLMIGMGYLLNKTHILGGTLDGGITKLVLFVTMPAMVLNSVLSQSGARDTGKVMGFLLIAIIMYLILPLVAYPLTAIIKAPKANRGLYMFMVIFGNVGFMGMPLVAALYGDDSVLYAGIFNMIFNVVSYSYGIIIVMRDGAYGENHKLNKTDGNGVENESEVGVENRTENRTENRAENRAEGTASAGFKLSWKQLLTPGISVSLLALVVYFVNISLPDVVCSVVAYLGNLTTPLAMLVIGSTLANMKFKEVVTDLRVYIFVLARSLVLPLLFFPIMKFLIKDSFMLEFTFVMLIMPVANSSVLYAKQYGSDEKLAAKCVFVSTLFSIVTIPVLALICF